MEAITIDGVQTGATTIDGAFHNIGLFHYFHCYLCWNNIHSSNMTKYQHAKISKKIKKRGYIVNGESMEVSSNMHTDRKDTVFTTRRP